jgi:hypothetical protein
LILAPLNDGSAAFFLVREFCKYRERYLQNYKHSAATPANVAAGWSIQVEHVSTSFWS